MITVRDFEVLTTAFGPSQEHLQLLIKDFKFNSLLNAEIVGRPSEFSKDTELVSMINALNERDVSDDSDVPPIDTRDGTDEPAEQDPLELDPVNSQLLSESTEYHNNRAQVAAIQKERAPELAIYGGVNLQPPRPAPRATTQYNSVERNRTTTVQGALDTGRVRNEPEDLHTLDRTATGLQEISKTVAPEENSHTIENSQVMHDTQTLGPYLEAIHEDEQAGSAKLPEDPGIKAFVNRPPRVAIMHRVPVQRWLHTGSFKVSTMCSYNYVHELNLIVCS